MTQILPSIRHAASARLPTEFGEFSISAFTGEDTARPYIALIMGKVRNATEVLTRVHSACVTGDLFSSTRCDCGQQLKRAQKEIAEAGQGVIVYASDQEGRGIGLIDKIDAYYLQDRDNLDTIDANRKVGHEPDERDYGMTAAVLGKLGVSSVRLMTNNPDKIEALQNYGINVCERVELIIPPTVESLRYLITKRERAGHIGIGLS